MTDGREPARLETGKDPLDLLPLSLREVLDNLEDVGIYITDRDRRILFWNKAASRITSFSSTEIVGRTCFDNVLCHVDRHGRQLCESSVCPLALSMDHGRPVGPPTFVFGMNKEGKRIPMTVTVSPIRDRHGRVVGGMELFRDASAEVHDLELAQTIQRSWLPQAEQTARWPFLGYACCMSQMVGGDLVRLFPGKGGTVAGLLVDVSGHGVSSAMLTGVIVSLLLPLEGTVSRPAEILRHLARTCPQKVLASHYFSGQAFVLDPQTGRLWLGNAGHPYPVILDEGGHGRFFEVRGDLIGLHDKSCFAEAEIDLTGQRLVMYSDGLTEAPDPRRHRLGEKRFLDLCRRAARLPPEQLARALVDEVFAFTNSTDPEDDMTVLVIDGPGRPVGPG